MQSTKLSANLLVGMFQLFLWLFFHPNGWLAYTSEIVDKDFSLLSLSSEERETIGVKRLLLIGHVIYPLLTTIIVCVVLYNIPSVSQENVLLGTTIGFTISLFIGVTISTVLSVAGGITGSIVSGLVSGIVIGMADHQVGVADGIPQFLIDSFPSVTKAMGISFIVSAGAISTVLNSISTSYIPIPIHERSIRRRVRKALDYLRTKRQSIVLTLIFSFILGLIIVVGFVNQIMGELMRGHTSLNIATLALGLLVYTASLFIPIHLNASNKIKDSLIYALLISLSTACIASISYYLSILSIQSISSVTIFQGIAFSIGNSVFFCLLYLSTHEAIKRFYVPFLTTWLPTLVTGLGSASFFLFFIAPAISGSLENLEIGSSLSIILLAGVVTLTSNWWISVLTYPFQLLMGFILYKMDKKSERFLFRYHPAFWHDHQFIPLYGLEKHLLSYLLMDDNKIEDTLSPKDIIKHLYANSKQQWAAREAQLKLDIGYLEKCAEFEGIAKVHLKLGDLLYGGASDGDVNFFQTISREVTQFLEVERLSGKYADVDAQRSDLKKIAKKLGTQYDALERSTNKYAPRLRIVAYSWASIVLTKRNNLKDSHPNPYTPGVVLRQQHGTFFGRHHITKQIQRLLWDTKHQSILLYGQRRMGKTSLLYNLQRMLPQRIITFFIDAQGPLASSKSESHFFENMISQMQEYAEDRQLIIPSPNQEHLSSKPASAFKNWLNIVQKAIIQDSSFLKTTILILIDEYEELDRAFAIGRLDPHIILGTLRHIIQHSQNVKILFAGSHQAGEFQYWSHFLLNTKVVHLNYLKEDDAIQLIKEPIARHPWKYQQDSIQRIVELTNNHPYLIHLLCYEIVTSKDDEMIEGAIKDVSLLDIEIAVEKSLSSGGQFFDDIVYNQLKNDALTLSLLCHLAQHEEVTRQQLLILSSDAKQIEICLRLLIERELIHYVNNKYRFQVELIRLWFCNWVKFHKYIK